MQVYSEYEMYKIYHEMLEEVYWKEVEICGYTFSQADTWKDADPIGYRCGFSDFTSDEYREIYDEDGKFMGYVNNEEWEAEKEEEEEDE